MMQWRAADEGNLNRCIRFMDAHEPLCMKAEELFRRRFQTGLPHDGGVCCYQLTNRETVKALLLCCHHSQAYLSALSPLTEAEFRSFLAIATRHLSRPDFIHAIPAFSPEQAEALCRALTPVAPLCHRVDFLLMSRPRNAALTDPADGAPAGEGQLQTGGGAPAGGGQSQTSGGAASAFTCGGGGAAGGGGQSRTGKAAAGSEKQPQTGSGTPAGEGQLQTGDGTPAGGGQLQTGSGAASALTRDGGGAAGGGGQSRTGSRAASAFTRDGGGAAGGGGQSRTGSGTPAGEGQSQTGKAAAGSEKQPRTGSGAPCGGGQSRTGSGAALPPPFRICENDDNDFAQMQTLHALYLREEVANPLRPFPEETARSLALPLLRGKTLWGLYEGTTLISKLNTNAAGRNTLQLGGMITRKEYRNRRFASALLSDTCRRLNREGWDLSLFVKTDNRPALRLYRSTLFTEISTLTLLYFSPSSDSF